MGLLQFCVMVFLLGEMCYSALGEDFTVQFESRKTCFEEGKDISLVVEYTGAGTPGIVKWKFNKMTDPTKTLDIVTAFCTASEGADAAFPISRMNYTCDNTLKKYTTKIRSFSEANDAGTWQVALSIGGTFTNFQNVTVEKCAGGLDLWIILVIVFIILLVVLYVIGIILGYKYSFPKKNRNKKKDNCCCIIEGMPTWYKALWFTVIGTPVAFGIFCVLKCCKQGN